MIDLKAELAIEAMCCFTVTMDEKLYDVAAGRERGGNCGFYQTRSQTIAAMGRSNTQVFDQRPARAAKAEMAGDRHLYITGDCVFLISRDKTSNGRVAGQGIIGGKVALNRLRPFTSLSDRIVGQQGDDARHITSSGGPDVDRGSRDQAVHPPNHQRRARNAPMPHTMVASRLRET